MATAFDSDRTTVAAPGSAATLFGAVVAAVVVAAALLAGWAPLGFSIVTVFLFAGPHNWFEARYFMNRMPMRWGPLRPYFLTGIGGVLALTGAFAALPFVAEAADWSHETWLSGTATWNTALVLWIVALARMRRAQSPRRAWPLAVPIGFVLIAATWLWPREWSLLLVYLHPLLALWFLDRELGKHQPGWRGAYRTCLAALPLLLGILWWRLSDAPSLPGDDGLSLRIANHAGAEVLAGVSSHLLVSTHTFLEMLHYGVWLVAIPLVSLRAAPWSLTRVPLAQRSWGWRWALASILLLGAAMVVGFWAGFLADYPLTRDVYFTVAMLHVLAEVPFLLRLL